MRVKPVALSLSAIALVVCGLFGCGDDGGPANDSPVIASLVASADTVDPTARVTLTCVASDGDGDSLTYSWDLEDGEITGAGPSITWTAPIVAGSYSVWVAVSDDRGGQAADTVEVKVLDGVLLVSTNNELLAVTLSGIETVFNETARQVEILGNRIFAGPGSNILELDRDGNLVATIARPSEIPGSESFVVLPDAGFAFVSESNDSIYFMDSSGGFVAAGPIPTPSPPALQSTRGLCLGTTLLMADTQARQVFAYDLETHEGSVFKDLAALSSKPFDIDYSAGTFYVVCSAKIGKFTETGDAATICDLPMANVVSLAVVGSYAYAAGYQAGAIYKVNIYTGDYEVLLDGLIWPRDIEYLRLEP
jgi:hypothetical protein